MAQHKRKPHDNPVYEARAIIVDGENHHNQRYDEVVADLDKVTATQWITNSAQNAIYHQTLAQGYSTIGCMISYITEAAEDVNFLYEDEAEKTADIAEEILIRLQEQQSETKRRLLNRHFGGFRGIYGFVEATQYNAQKVLIQDDIGDHRYLQRAMRHLQEYLDSLD